MTNEEYNRMINGDTDEFCRFYEKYAPAVYRKILSSTDKKEEARTLLKEVFSDCCLRMRAAGENADPIALLLDAVCDRKLDRIAPTNAEQESTPEENFADEYTQTKKTPEEILQDAEKEAPAEPASEPKTEKIPEEVPPTPPAEATDTSPTRVFEQPVASTEPETKSQKPKKRHTLLWVLLSIFLSLLFLGLVWVVIGILSADAIIPPIDLGYNWFNSHIYPFF